MRKVLLLTMAIVLSCVCVAGHAAETNFANDAFASQLTMDAFNKSVRYRMQVARFDFYGGVKVPPAQSYVDGNLDGCPESAFTIWADGYTAWGKKKDSDGYKFNVAGPALGFDWSNGPLTLGVAGTYAWGKMKDRETWHENKNRTWALTTYAQLNYERFYVNADLSYGRNRFKSTRKTFAGVYTPDDPADAKYHSNAWNAEMEIGTRLNLCNFLIEPHIGVRYFHDRRGGFDENNTALPSNYYSKRNYHALEMPIGVDVGYEIAVCKTMLIPRLHFAYIPQFDRKAGTASADVAQVIRDSSSRARHGFELGAGLQAKVYRSLSAHVDYNVNMRSKAYEHTVTAGLGMSF